MHSKYNKVDQVGKNKRDYHENENKTIGTKYFTSFPVLKTLTFELIDLNIIKLYPKIKLHLRYC